MPRLGASGESEQFPLIVDGAARCSIVGTDNAQVNSDIDFFTNAVFRCTGASLKVGAKGVGAQVGGNRIVFEVEERPLPREDAYEVVFPDAHTLKVRGTDQSCRWALNRLLEEAFGVVFCLPGLHGTHYPRQRTVTVPRRPLRGDAALHLQRRLYAEDPAWERSLNGKTQRGEFVHHAMYTIFPPKKYFAEPWISTMMPERKGKRVKPDYPYSAWQPCFASDVAVAEAVSNICAHLEAHPDQKVCSLSVNDQEGYCECAACKALNGGSFGRRSRFGTATDMDHSPSYYHWCNRVAEGVTARHPGVLFGAYAYCGTIDPPPFRLHPSIVPCLEKEIFKLREPGEMDLRRKLIAAWCEKATFVGLDDWAFGCVLYIAPRLYNKSLADYLKLKDEFPQIESFFAENSSFIGEGPKRYLYYRHMWDPHVDQSDELDRWCAACVGETAGPLLKEYYAIWDRLWASRELAQTRFYRDGKDALYFTFDNTDYVFALSRAEFDRANRLMRAVVEAAKRDGDAEQTIRSERLSHFHDFYAARITAAGAFRSQPDGSFSDVVQAAAFVRSLGEIGAAQERLPALVERVCADKYADQGEKFSKWPCRSFRDRVGINSSVTDLFNSLLPYLGTSEVKAALAEAAADSRIAPDRARMLRGLGWADRLPNLAVAGLKTQADELRSWRRQTWGIAVEPEGGGSPARLKLTQNVGWSAAMKVVHGLETNRNYLCSGRLTNATKRPISVTLIFSSRCDDLPDGSLGKDGGHPSQRVFEIASGETAELRMFARTSRRCRGASIYVVPTIGKGESVFLEGFAVQDLETDLIETTPKEIRK